MTLAGGPPRVALLHLNDAILERMATDPVVRSQFGVCFAGLARRRPCAPCGKGARRTGADYAAVRDCIGGLPPDKMVLLKRVLGADRVRLEVRRGQSRVQLTF